MFEAGQYQRTTSLVDAGVAAVGLSRDGALSLSINNRTLMLDLALNASESHFLSVVADVGSLPTLFYASVPSREPPPAQEEHTSADPPRFDMALKAVSLESVGPLEPKAIDDAAIAQIAFGAVLMAITGYLARY